MMVMTVIDIMFVANLLLIGKGFRHLVQNMSWFVVFTVVKKAMRNFCFGTRKM